MFHLWSISLKALEIGENAVFYVLESRPITSYSLVMQVTITDVL